MLYVLSVHTVNLENVNRMLYITIYNLILQLPARIYENTTTTGFLNIIFSLLKSSSLQVSGKVNEDIAEIRQWLEYAIVYASNCDSGQNFNQILTVSR